MILKILRLQVSLRGAFVATKQPSYSRSLIHDLRMQ